MAEEDRQQRRRFANLRSVQWRIDLGILPASPGASVDKLRHATADSRRRYVSLRRRLMVDPHLPKEEDRSSNLVVDNPLSQNPGFLEKVASSHLFGSIALLAKSGNLSLTELMLEWSRTSLCFYATSRVDKGLSSELQNQNWRVLSVANECSIEVPGVLNVQRLQQLLLTLATLIKRRCGSVTSVTVAVYGDEDKPALIMFTEMWFCDCCRVLRLYFNRI
ncbi:Inositol-tetrakisphosphate 1-kinase 6 [Zea mays]|uniref:Inositol-tetrakisphosphate 1-kinase 6 n=1 Tax=Zea mays TaxID=4577 RepID=A0A3L6EQH2_MAIZE|nr:Inositol-tetrakisphosphate 1-kinase 6 [Zea mays]